MYISCELTHVMALYMHITWKMKYTNNERGKPVIEMYNVAACRKENSKKKQLVSLKGEKKPCIVYMYMYM